MLVISDSNLPAILTNWAAGLACIPCSTNPVDEDYCVEGPKDGEKVIINLDGNPITIEWGADQGIEQIDLAAINLVSGYNLISLPIVPINTSLPAPIDSIEGNYEIVWAYDACDTLDPWKKFVPGIPPALYDLYEMYPSYGYWVKMTISDTLIT